MREKEAIPSWNKFLQGYYDASGIASDSFERAVSLSPEGAPEASPAMRSKGIRLRKAVASAVHYTGFNMQDKGVGGLDEAHCKLRQAIGIVLDTEEYVQIFQNGRGITAMQPVPPGFFGFEEGEAAMDPHLFVWDPAAKAPRRRSLEEAKRLLAEAGYPGGIGPDRRQLTIRFDNTMEQSEEQLILRWMQDRLEKIGIRLESSTTDYNRFQEKMHSGNFQMSQWGWYADYPDPENFLFLLYGPNSRSTIDGPNSANYENPGFDGLFWRMEAMPNGPERLELIRGLRAVFQHDAPWVQLWYPVDFGLAHAWIHNGKPNQVALNPLAYRRIDAAERARLRREWNRPNWPPVWIAGALLASGVALAAFSVLRRARGTA